MTQPNTQNQPDPAENEPDIEHVKLWDPAIRIFHWLLVGCVITSWGLGRFGPNIMTLHFYFGYAICALLAFRIIWGFVGPNPVRFSHFFYSPKTILTYLAGMLKRKPSYWRGHNPLGAGAALALLLILIAQVATGLVSDPDDFVNVGPFASYVGRDYAVLATRLHNMLSDILLILVGIHIAAIAFYKIWKKEDLIRPMITGWKWVKKQKS